MRSGARHVCRVWVCRVLESQRGAPGLGVILNHVSDGCCMSEVAVPLLLPMGIIACEVILPVPAEMHIIKYLVWLAEQDAEYDSVLLVADITV